MTSTRRRGALTGVTTFDVFAAVVFVPFTIFSFLAFG
jgi:hypothetical protein